MSDDMEYKLRHVRDSEFWGLPEGTPIKPGMKPKPKPRTMTGSTPKPKDKTPSSGSTPEAVKPVKPTDKPSADGAPETLPNGREPASPKKRIKTPGEAPTASEEPDTSMRENKDFSVESAAKELSKIKREGRKDGTGTRVDPIDCGDDIDLAHKLLSEGKHVRLESEMEVSLLIDKIAEEVKKAKENGDRPPDYNLCNVTVPGTNLFCLENKGVDRIDMPQFKGDAEPGSYAASKADKDGKADVMGEFAELLSDMGIAVETKEVKAEELKATQSELVAGQVAHIRDKMRNGTYTEEPIYVTRDGYVVDGHHRWAAKMALDLQDGKTGDIMMEVMVIDADIGYVLDLSNGFTEMAGIKPKSGKSKGTKMMAMMTRLLNIPSHHACTDGACSIESKRQDDIDTFLSMVNELLDTADVD